jgi:hypothetical protein
VLDYNIYIYVLYTSKLTHYLLSSVYDGAKESVHYNCPEKGTKGDKKGPQFDDNNWTTLCLAIIFNQREIVEDVARIKKQITDKEGLNSRSSYDEVQFYTNEFKKLNVKARKLADLE